MEPLTRRSGVFVLRRGAQEQVPDWLMDEETTERLRDGTLLLVGNVFRKNDTERATNALVDSVYFNGQAEDLAFHSDPRGIRWVKFGPFMDLPPVAYEDPHFGRASGIDIDYESAVAMPGVWVSVEEVHKRLAKMTEDERDAVKDDVTWLADALDELKPPATDLVKNVVVIGYRLDVLPPDVTLLGRLKDGTKLVVGPKKREWVDALKAAVKANGLRLIKGPESTAELLAFADFDEMVDEFRERGKPMMIMSTDP